MKGRHQLKFGYRWVVRFPSPFTNTDTRSTLEFNRNFTNDPATNTGGTGMAGLLLGHINSGARGFLLEPYTLTVHEHGAFIQDDFKVSPRLTINAGLRYEIFTPGVEEENRLTNFDSLNLRLVYAGENGTTRSANKKTQYNNCAPRLGIAWDLFGDSTTVLRSGYGVAYFPLPQSASNFIGQQVPYTISQNFTSETTPLDFSQVPRIDNPFPPVEQVKPETTEALNEANARVLGHSLENETPYTQHWHLSIERELAAGLVLELGYLGSKGTHLMMCRNANEVQPGVGSQASRRLIQPLSDVSTIIQCDPRNRSSYHGGQLKLSKRLSQGVQVQTVHMPSGKTAPQ
jgi:hypothetical protein